MRLLAKEQSDIMTTKADSRSSELSEYAAVMAARPMGDHVASHTVDLYGNNDIHVDDTFSL